MEMGVLCLVGDLVGDGRASAGRLAAVSRGALDRRLASDAELVVAVPEDEAVVMGAFERGGGVRRGSGGASARVGPGSVWVQLALARPEALVACEPAQLLNRYVRPLLKALTKSGALAHYFGRDWISVARRPCALVAFAHDASTHRALFEAIVAVRTPFALGARGSFLGKEPTTMAAHASGAEPAKVAEAIVEAYLHAYGRTPAPLSLPDAEAGPEPPEPPWAATRDEGIGTIAAGRDHTGRMRVGGELMASRDAIASLEDALARGEDPSRAVDEVLGPAVTFGVESLASIRDVILAAG